MTLIVSPTGTVTSAVVYPGPAMNSMVGGCGVGLEESLEQEEKNSMPAPRMQEVNNRTFFMTKGFK